MSSENKSIVLTESECAAFAAEDAFHDNPVPSGWQGDIEFGEQVDMRVQNAVNYTNERMRAAQLVVIDPLTEKQKGQALRDAAALLNPIGVDFSRLSVVEKPELVGLGERVTLLDSISLWSIALMYASQRLLEVLYELELPALIARNGLTHYHPERGVIALPLEYSAADLMLGTQQVIDGIGQTRAAAERVRAQDALPGKAAKTTFGLEALPGRWIDPADGLLDEACIPYLDAAAARFSGAQDESLSAMWTSCPRQVGLYLATMAGAWV